MNRSILFLVLRLIYQGKYLEAGKQFTSSIAFMELPLVIKKSLKTIIPENKYISPLTAIAYGGLVGLYSGYSTVKNTYSLYDELFNSKDNNIRSLTAYKDLSDLLSKSSYLQSIYDFKKEAIKYEISINNINLEFEKLETKQNLGKNKGEFGKKLYQYIYEPILEEKYDLLNKVIQQVITKEQKEAFSSKHISFSSNEIHYDYCMEIKKLKDWQDLIDNDIIEDEEHYYCYNTQEAILDHVSLITLDGVINNFEIVEHL
jgi:hypothetical protein